MYLSDISVHSLLSLFQIALLAEIAIKIGLKVVRDVRKIEVNR